MTRPHPDVAHIVVCEDSPSFAAGLKRFLEHDADLRVVATCTTGAEAVELVRRLRVDLVIMDLELPDGDGAEAIRQIVELRPLPILVLSAHAQRGSRRAAEALGAGALHAEPKDVVTLREPECARAVMFRRRVKRIARARMRPPRLSAAPSAPVAPHSARLIAVAASTGGPRAVEVVLRALPMAFAVPVLIVQHVAPGFVEGLVQWLDQVIAVPVGLAKEGQRASRGIWFAPDEAHLVVERDLRMRLDRETVSGYHRPSADVLFASAAAAAGRDAVSVVLTGMGTDGAAGTVAIRAAGGLTVAQDRSTSAIFGMPRAAAEQGAERVLALEDIGRVLAAMTPVRQRA